jgi:hypothetical protein
MPGRLVSAVRKAGCRDPLILLDEVDKMGHDHRCVLLYDGGGEGGNTCVCVWGGGWVQRAAADGIASIQ